MRPLALAGVLFALAACFGAAVLGNRQRPAEQPPTAGASQQRVRARARIDKTRIRQLAPVPAPADVGAIAMAHAERICAFGPRYAHGEIGRPGWTQQLGYIEQELTRLGLTCKRDTWTDRKELITFTNLAAVIPGKRAERILLACHHDTKCTTGHADSEHNFEFVGANDGASAVGLLLAPVPALLERLRDATIELVFFDGEESLDWRWNDAARALFGSRRYVRRHREARLLGEEPAILALVLLDMVGRKDLHIQDELFSTVELGEIAWSAAVATGHRDRFFRTADGASDDHVPFLEVGIPAVDLIDLDGNPHWHTVHDTLANMSAASIQVVADVVLTMLPEIERVYAEGRSEGGGRD